MIFCLIDLIRTIILFLLLVLTTSHSTPSKGLTVNNLNSPTRSGFESTLTSSKPSISSVKKNLKNHEIQIKLTVIDKGGNINYKFNVDNDDYFYPASTVKLPIALLAIEK